MVIKASVHCGRFIRGDYANSNNSYCSSAYGSDNGSGGADFWPGIKKSLYNLYTKNTIIDLQNRRGKTVRGRKGYVRD